MNERIQPSPECTRYASLLPVLADTPATSETSAAREHIENCRYCRSALADYDRIEQALRRVAATTPSLRTEDIMRSILTNDKTPTPTKRHNTPTSRLDQRPPIQHWDTRIFAVAAILVIVLLARSLFSAHPGSPADVPTPSVGPTLGEQLEGVAMLSPTDGWAVGYRQLAGTFTPLLYHFDGKTWTPTTIPLPAAAQRSQVVMLTGLSFRAPDDGWAVGGYTPSASLLYHFDGKTWTLSTQSFGHIIQKVQVISNGEAWASFNPGEQSNTVLHYDGTTWHEEAFTTTLSVQQEALAMISPQEGWLIGTTSSKQSVIFHYFQRKWSAQQQIDNVALTSLSMASADEGWAVGTMANTASLSVLWHYSHGQWQSAPLPANWTHSIDALDVRSTTEGWAFSDSPKSDTATTCQLYVATLTAQSWSPQVPLTISACREGAIKAFAFTANDGWAVGLYQLPQNALKPSAVSGYALSQGILILRLVNGVWTVYQQG